MIRSAAAPLALVLCVLLMPQLTWSQGKPAPKAPPKAPAKAPAPPQDPTQVRVNVGVSTAKPNDIIDIPLTLSAPDAVKIGTVSEIVSFPKNALSLTKAELGLAGEQSQADVKTDVKDSPDDPATSLIDVSISTKAPPLKPGILAYLKFKVAPTAEKGTIVLKIMDFKATSGTGEALQQAVKGKDGEVTVFGINEEIPVVGCFFFNH